MIVWTIKFLNLLCTSNSEHLSCGHLRHIRYFLLHFVFISKDAYPSLTPLIGGTVASMLRYGWRWNIRRWIIIVGFHCHDNVLTLFRDPTYPVAQQDHVLVRGKPVRTHRVLDSRNALASPDFSDIHLLEAEQALTVLAARHLELLQEYKASVIMDFTVQAVWN
jgi:hypothetical protein